MRGSKPAGFGGVAARQVSTYLLTYSAGLSFFYALYGAGRPREWSKSSLRTQAPQPTHAEHQ